MQLDIKFSGVLNDNLVGFYRSSYTATDGSTQYARLPSLLLLCR